jgi:tetratricopeptide (TPR) repeat protein
VLVSVTLSNSREAEIADALGSVAPHVDRVLLVDTGIADRTIRYAKKVVGEKLLVAEHEWVDFSTARNAALAEARSLGAKWIVIVDSDERFDFGSVDLRAALKKTRADVLSLESVEGTYEKPKIVRASAKVRFEGPTHERLVGERLREKLAGVVFDELPKSKTELAAKCDRDVGILTDYAAERDDPRWWFYLGQSLEGVNKHARAAEAYRRCADLRRVGDEAAWAAYRQADQLYRLGRHEESIAVAAKGMGSSPLAECAWMAAVVAHKLGRNEESVAWARMAEAVGMHNGCGKPRSFFRHPPALFELPYDVLRFALPDAESRKKADLDYQAAQHARLGVSSAAELDRLSVSREAPLARCEEARQLLRPDAIGKMCSSARFTPLDFKPPKKNRRAMNPSICVHDGELWCVVRTVNYWVKGRRYGILDEDGITRTENYLGLFRRDGRLTGMRRMRDLDRSYQEPLGYEDVRLASVGGKLVGSATVCDKKDTKIRRVASLKFGGGDVVRARVQPNFQKHEKNWMPFDRDGKLVWIYSLDPTVILPTGIKRSCPFRLEHLRGGAVTEFEDGYLCVTHEVVDEVDGRIYLHRFVRLDERFNVTAVSPAFVFDHYGIEFAAGLVVDGGKIVVSFGIEDKQAWILRVDVGEVESMFYTP